MINRKIQNSKKNDYYSRLIESSIIRDYLRLIEIRDYSRCAPMIKGALYILYILYPFFSPDRLQNKILPSAAALSRIVFFLISTVRELSKIFFRI